MKCTPPQSTKTLYNKPKIIQWPDFLDKYANFIPGTAHDSFLHFRPQLCPLNSSGIVFCAAHFYVSRLSFRARIAFYLSHSLICLSATSVFCPNPFLLLSYLFWLTSLSKFLSSTQLWSTFQKRFFTIFYSSFTVASLGFTQSHQNGILCVAKVVARRWLYSNQKHL